MWSVICTDVCKLSWTESMIPEKSDMLCTVSSPYTAESLALKYQH